MRYHLLKGAESRRVVFLDEARGLCILLMVAYHAAYDLVYIFGVGIPAFHWPILRFAQPFVAGIFIFISGIACRYSRSNAKRGLIALSLGVAMSVFTILAMPEQAIYFGILHFLGTAMLLYALLKKPLDMFSVFFGVLLFVILFAVSYHLPDGYLGFGKALSFSLSAAAYRVPYLFPLGFGGIGADYFPLIPWLFLFLAGSYFGVFFTENAFPAWFYRTHSRPLAWFGRRTLIIYLLHQPVIYGILWILFRVVKPFGA